MDRRRLVRAAVSAAGLSGSGALTPGSVRAQAVRSRSPEYAGAMTVMWRTVQWVLQEVSRLMAAQERSDEEWRIDVLAPFAAVTSVRDAARAIVPPAKYTAGHALWLEALDELVSAGLHLRNGVLADNERSFQLATRAIESATDLIAEVEVALPRRVRRTL